MPNLPLIRNRSLTFLLWSAAAGLCLGCTSPLFRGQSPEPPEELIEIPESDETVRLVGDLAVPLGLNWMKVEGVALVTQLAGSGSDPPPSPLRDKLIKEMQTHDVKQYGKALASPDTSMVIVRGFIPPGARQGDPFDVEVRVPPRSKTSSLREGWLMQTRLRELQLLDTMREGHVTALASGAILVDSIFETNDEAVAETRGRIPGGGTVQKTRQLGLAISNEHSSVRTSALIGAAINERFHHFDRGAKKGVANPKRDNMLELAVHPRYDHNLGRYIRVIRSIAVGEGPGERAARLTTLKRMLLEPTTAEAAALQLEAIGQAGVPVLREGLSAFDAEVRFYAAEALAYLDEPAAADPLRLTAESERAFRWRALTALAAMDSYEAQEAVAQLMTVASAETRYGAFRAMRVRNPRDPTVRGEVLDGKFGFHTIASSEEPLLHFSRTRRPELVIFGNALRMRPPVFLYAGNSILIKRVDDQTIRLSCFRPGQEDQFAECSTEVSEVVRSIVKLGGSYADVFAGLRAAKEQGYLEARIEVDAIPSANRRYRRQEMEDSHGPDRPRYHVTNPFPEMFSDRLSSAGDEDERPRAAAAEDDDLPQDERTKRGFFDRISSWMMP